MTIAYKVETIYYIDAGKKMKEIIESSVDEEEAQDRIADYLITLNNGQLRLISSHVFEENTGVEIDYEKN